MEDGSSKGGALAAAPFVVKTYRMVDDPATDPVISWGKDNNSFVVADPFVFSRTLLSAYFKHSNFSSFIRQLNTYGFRKVDPDRWEFAHASFLKGQTRLLQRIIRRNGSNSKGGGRGGEGRKEEEYEERMAMEVVRLKEEQRKIEEKMQHMWRRVQETERRRRQMLAFLVKVAGDPLLLHRLMGTTEGGKKRARLRLEGNNGELEAAAPVEVGVGMDERFQSLPVEYSGGLLPGDDMDSFINTVDSVGVYGGPGSGVGGVEMGGGGGAYPYSFPVGNRFDF